MKLSATTFESVPGSVIITPGVPSSLLPEITLPWSALARAPSAPIRLSEAPPPISTPPAPLGLATDPVASVPI